MNIKLSSVLFFIIIITFYCDLRVICQNIPRIACPNIFQYMNQGGVYTGKITLNNVPLSTVQVEAQFSQREPIKTTFSGQLSLIDDLPTTQINIENGRQVSYRVDFPNPYILPKLTGIKMNDQILCYDNGYSPPSTSFKVHHIFYPSPTALSRSRNYNVEPTQKYIFNNGLIQQTPIQYHFVTDKRPTIQKKPNPPTNRPSINRITFVTNKPNPVLRPTLNQQPNNPPTNQNPVSATRPRESNSISCGQEAVKLTSFVVGGNNLERGRFPWLTAIYIRESVDLKFTCGGSLISSRTVITAAHCFLDPRITADRIVLYLGRNNLYHSEPGVEQRDVQSLIKHPEFNTKVIADADIALLQMRTPVSFTQYIRPICLWSQPISIPNLAAYVAGWGSDNRGADVTPIAKVVEVNVVNETECLRSSPVFISLTSSRSICAGKRDGNGPCIGDSGGGLMMNTAGSWMLRGVVSLGITENINNRKSCDLNEYVVYCDIAKHNSWVRRNLLQ